MGMTMRCGWLTLLTTVAAAAVLVAAAPVAARPDLQADIELLAAPPHSGGDFRLGVSVVDLKTNKVLAAIKPDDAFIPASNQKLLTSGTALAVLGPDYEFRTDFIIAPEGLLIIKGCGDPALADPELLDDMRMSPAAFVDSIATAIAGARGDDVISQVIVDDRVFDREYVHATWPTNQLNRWYCAEVSGLNFHCNVLRVYASPGAREGEKGIVKTDPVVPWAKINDSRLVTVTGRNASTGVGADRAQGTNNISVHGTVKQALVEPIEVTVHEGSLIFARLLGERLKELGAARPAADGVIAVRLATPDEQFPAGRIAATVRTPLPTVLERCNTDSHNLYAEALIKAAGHAATGQPGSWLNGAAVVRMQIQDRLGGAEAMNVTITDGSGMSRNNRITPAFMTRWLASIADDDRIGASLIDSLAIPAARTGTLRSRFQQATLANKVRAKSGYLNGVRTLSGYVIHEATGRTVAFSILVNDIGPKARHDKIKKMQEDIVEAVDDWLSDEVLSDPTARPMEAIGG